MNDMGKKDMGERLKKLRKTLNLTQPEFARSMGFVRSDYSKIEMGNIELSDAGRLMSLVKLYNVSWDWLLSGNGEMFLKNNDNFKVVWQLTLESEKGKECRDMIQILLALKTDEEEIIQFVRLFWH